jgi:hypothetical protein
MQPLTFTDLHALPPVVNLMTAALGIGIGRTKEYHLAQHNQFPCCVIRIGRAYHVPTADLLILLGIPPAPTSTNQQT